MTQAAFDAFVAGSRQPEFLQTWAWGELKRETGWVPHRLLIAGPEGRPLAAASVLERQLPGLGPLLYAPRGPILDWSDPRAVGLALERLRALARERRAVALKVDPGVPLAQPACAKALAADGWRRLETGPAFEGVQPHFHMQLSLEGRGEEELLAAMHPKTRYHIRLAERRGVRVRAGGPEDIAAFYAVLRETAERDGFGIRGATYFQGMWRHCLSGGLGWLLLAEADGELLAGAIIFQVGAYAWYLYGASSNRRRELMAPHAVQWEAIRRSLAAGCRVYDFRGVSGDLRPEAPLYGLYRFKKGFGAALVELSGEWDLVLRPGAYWLAEHGVPVARRLVGRLRGRRPGQGQPAE